MRFFVTTLCAILLVIVSGCKSSPSQYSDVPPPSKTTPAPAEKKGGEPKAKPVIKPVDALTGKVVTYNVVGRFAVLNFPVTRMPATDSRMFVYREGLKVGEFKITGPVKDDNIVADLLVGEARVGDEVRDH